MAGGSMSGALPLRNESGGAIIGRGTINMPLVNNGKIVAGDGTLRIANAFSNAGVIEMAGSTATLSGGAISNIGTIEGFGSINNVISNTSGSIEAAGGTLVLTGPLPTSTGLLAASNGNKLLFTQGLAINAGTISLAGGTFDNGSKVMSNIGQISGYGIFRSGGLTNNGAITFAGGTTTVNGNVTNSAGKKVEVRFAPAVFTGTFTNNGIFKSTSAQVTFTGAYIENGQFISDPAENIFQDVSIGTDGAWSGGLGDLFVIGGDLINASTNTQLWQTSQAELHFVGGHRHHYLTASRDLGSDSFSGYEQNFAWGKLVLSSSDSLLLDGPALYVGILDLPDGLPQIQSITSAATIYYDLRQPENLYLQGQTYALSGGGSITPVPEPAINLLLLLFVPAMQRKRTQAARRAAISHF